MSKDNLGKAAPFAMGIIPGLIAGQMMSSDKPAKAPVIQTTTPTVDATTIPESPLVRKRKQQAAAITATGNGTLLSDAAGNKETLG